MNTLLAFEVVRKEVTDESERAASRFRREIESTLKRSGWEHTKVHTTFVRSWQSVDDTIVKADFHAIVKQARIAATNTESMIVEFVFMCGGKPPVEYSF